MGDDDDDSAPPVEVCSRMESATAWAACTPDPAPWGCICEQRITLGTTLHHNYTCMPRNSIILGYALLGVAVAILLCALIRRLLQRSGLCTRPGRPGCAVFWLVSIFCSAIFSGCVCLGVGYRVLNKPVGTVLPCSISTGGLIAAYTSMIFFSWFGAGCLVCACLSCVKSETGGSMNVGEGQVCPPDPLASDCADVKPAVRTLVALESGSPHRTIKRKAKNDLSRQEIVLDVILTDSSAGPSQECVETALVVGPMGDDRSVSPAEHCARCSEPVPCPVVLDLDYDAILSGTPS
eukprot:m.102688 g.102688  ORF g.102688 m.102688 type:complete len:293 (+) comp51542_c1_seq8:145-1023(+)